MMSNNQRIIANQEELIHKLSWYQNYGCFNRNGFEYVKWPEIAHKAKWIVYFDVDGVHEINQAHETYDVFNAMMKDVLSKVRASDAVAVNVIAALYNSGDEFLLCVTEESTERANDRRHETHPEKLVERLTEELARHGLTAIFAIEPVKSLLLDDNVKPAADRVLAAKKARGTSR